LKALINDQFQRLEELCTHADIPVHRWHGDVSSSQKKNFRKRPGGVLLITPESIESCFINYGNQVGTLFRDLEFVVIDEIHDFLGDPRGHHLRSLLHRLEQAIGHSFRHVGLSATLGDFAQARSYLNRQHPDRVTIIEAEGSERCVRVGIRAFPWKPNRGDSDGDETKPLASDPKVAAKQILAICEDPTRIGREDTKLALETPAPPDGGECLPAEHFLAADIARVFSQHANLVFTNSRALGEIVADQIHQIAERERWPRNPFVLHHGSLSKEVRSDVEKRLKDGEPLTALCTSTLEMGIDIGSVYSVGQLGPPWSVASMVQRLGRSGRKEGESAILRLYTLDEPPWEQSKLDDLLCPQLLRGIAMVQLMTEKWLEPIPPTNQNLSTLVHQILSVLRQTGGVSASEIYSTLCEKGYFDTIAPQRFQQVLRSLGNADLVEQMANGLLILAPDGERITHSREFYANFIGSEDYTIRHRGDNIGKLPSTAVPPVGEHFILNGRRWSVDHIEHRSNSVDVLPARGLKKTPFSGESGDIHPVVAQRMLGVLRSEESYPMLHRDAQLLLDAARKLFRSCHLDHRPLIVKPGCCQFFPWTGGVGFRTLQLCAAKEQIQTSREPLSITYHCNEEKLLAHLARITRLDFDPVELASLIAQKSVEKFDDYLPDDILDELNAQRRISLSDAAAACRLLT
jgi:ATP-dependent Lhr-like helicase